MYFPALRAGKYTISSPLGRGNINSFPPRGRENTEKHPIRETEGGKAVKYFEKCLVPALVCLGLFLVFSLVSGNQKPYTATTFVMDTVATQTVYGRRGAEAASAVEDALRGMDARLSLYNGTGDIARLAQSAGSGEPVAVDPQTYALLEQSQALAAQTEGAFQLTVGPLTLAWGISGDTPRVPAQQEIDALLPLVDDAGLFLQDGTARLCTAGQAVDLGGVAKGAACDTAKALYTQYGISSALCWVGGSSIYAHGTKPDGSLWRIGFRDPAGDGHTSIASFEIRDAAFATSGGYERYFERDGVRYQHILDPQTGRPAQTDIVSIGILAESGLAADLWSTALFVQGKEKALAYFAAGGEGLLLDEAGNLYVSAALQSSFSRADGAGEQYQIIFL